MSNSRRSRRGSAHQDGPGLRYSTVLVDSAFREKKVSELVQSGLVLNKTSFAEDHVELLRSRKEEALLAAVSLRRADTDRTNRTNASTVAPPSNYLFLRMKRLMHKPKDGYYATFFKILDFPLDLMRDYTIPPAEEGTWDRLRASITPVTMVLAVTVLWPMLPGNIADHKEDPDNNPLTVTYIAAFSTIPGAICGLGIRFWTKQNDPPDWLRIVYAILAFVMSVVWIKFTTDNIVDILQLYNYVTTLPKTFFGLTILAWGNSLGDVSADTAMTRKGFGEMAVTGTLAGPVFNVLLGLGLGLTVKLASRPDIDFVPFSIWKMHKEGEPRIFNKNAVLPLGLIVGQLTVLTVILVGAITREYHVDIRTTLTQFAVYVACLTFLVIYVFFNLDALGD